MSLSHTIGGVLVTASLSAAAFFGASSATPATPTPTPTPTATAVAPPFGPDAGALIPGKGVSSKPSAARSAHPQSLGAPGVAPLNDNWNNAAAYTPARSLVGAEVDLMDATTEPGENLTLTPTSIYQIYNTAWIKWTPAVSGYLEADTFETTGSLSASDTTLAVYSGSSLKKAKRLAFNDDAPGHGNLSQVLGLRVKGGTTYHFQLGLSYDIGTPAAAVNSAHGGFAKLDVNIDYDAPSNDNIGAAKVETGSHWLASGYTLGSTTQSGETLTSSASSPIADSIWYAWTPVASGHLSFESNPAIYDDLDLTNDNYVVIYQLDHDGDFTRSAFYQGDFITDTNFVFTSQSTYYFGLGELTADEGAPQSLSVTATYTGPQITKLSSKSGSHNGGQTLTITGVNLTGTSAVEFGPTHVVSDPAAITVVSSTKVTVKVPPGVKGTTVYVYLRADGNSTNLTSKAKYKFS
jgi:hypothetical protein